MNRLSKGAFGRPSSTYSLPDYLSWQVEPEAQIGQRSECPIYNKVAGCASIKRLFSRGCPVAVVGIVTLVIVRPFKCQSDWFFSHIGKKLLEPEPLLADLNSSTSVVRPPWIARIGTPLDHHAPRAIGGTSFTSLVASVTVSGVVFFRHGIGPFVHNAVSAVGDRRQPALTAILN